MLQKYYDKTSTIHDIAVVLEPRFKLEYYKKNKFGKKFIDDLKTAVKDFLSTYALTSESETSKTVTELTDSQIFTFVVDTQSKQKSQIIELETNFYENVESPKIDPLDYWRKNAFRFKTLSRVAKDYLAMPGTSVSIEEKFSLAGELITTKRNRLLPETKNEVMCVNS